MTNVITRKRMDFYCIGPNDVIIFNVIVVIIVIVVVI